MGNEFTSEEIDNSQNVEAIINIVKEDISCLKDFMAKRDTEIVRKATKGIGTDNSSLLDTLCNRTKKQLDAADLHYHKTYESSLLKIVSSEVSGNFGKMMKYSLMDSDALGAEIFTIATKGLGTKDHVLIDLLHTHNNEERAAMKKKWEAKNNKSMLDCLNSELSGNARKIMVMMLMGEKSDSEEVDPTLAEEQAAALHAAGVKKLMGTDDDVFLGIFGRESRAQIQAIKAAYERNHRMSLMRAISKETSGTYKKCLLACLFPTVEAYTAYALFKAFEGMGTDEDRVTRLLGGTDKKKMKAVSAYYLDAYGKSIVEDLKDELSGTFLKAALCWASGYDPTGGMEYIIDVADPSNSKDMAKALLQERGNIKQFICQADAIDIREACKGMGTNDNRLISIICGRTKDHLATVNQKYHSTFGMSLEAQIKHECFGNFKDLMTYTLLPEADFDALMLKSAMDGIGTNEGLIISILAPQSNSRILAARARHDQKYPKPLIDRLKSELSGSLEDLVIALINGERQDDVVDENLAIGQAKELHNAGIGKRMGTDKKTFIRILSQASRPQIQLIKGHYERNHGMSLERAIKKECSGSFEKMLLAIVMDPVAFYALQLNTAFKSMVTDKGTVARVLGGNDKPFVDEISACYQTTYGTSLVEALKSETGGKFRRAALTWVCSSNPMSSGNNLAEAFEGLPKDEACEEDEIVVDRQDCVEELEAEGGSGGGGWDDGHNYERPPPPVYYTVCDGHGGGNASMGGGPMGSYMMDQGGGSMHQEPQWQNNPPPPYDEEEEEDSDDGDYDDDSDSDDDFSVPMVGASDQQMIELRRLARRRTQAIMSGNAGKVNRTQERIKYLKWQIESSA